MNTAATNTYRITTSTGLDYTDRAKNTLGGYVNLLNRISLNLGSSVRPRLTSAMGESATFTVGAITGTITPA